MSDSILIFGGNKDLRRKKALDFINASVKKTVSWSDMKKSADIRLVEIPGDRKSIGIGEIRDAVRFLGEKPFSEKLKFVVVDEANTMTREAQNAFLKTLEEPPYYAKIILLSKTVSDMLETVVSRCKKVDIRAGQGSEKNLQKPSDNELFTEENGYENVLKLGTGKRLEWAAEISKEEREDIVEILELWLAHSRQIMLDSPNKDSLENCDRVKTALERLENTNAGARIILEALVVELL